MPTITNSITLSDIVDGTNGVNGDVFKTIYLFQNGTTSPTVPSNTEGFVPSTGIAANTGDWTITATVPPAGETIYVASATLIRVANAGDWSISVSWVANPAASSGSNGSAGSDAPRFGEITLYTNPGVAVAPSAPSATITWATGNITAITAGWSRTPPTQAATSTLVTYSSQVVFVDIAPPFDTTTATGTTPVAAINFDGLVTFTGGDFAVDGSTITSIDGGNITTGSITLEQINDIEFAAGANGNIGLGEDALSLVTTGIRNVAIGSFASPDLTTPDQTVALGFNAECELSTTSNEEGAPDQFTNVRGFTYNGDSQVALGSSAKAYGATNTVVGASASVSDEFNTDIGHARCVAVGFLSEVRASNSVAIGAGTTVTYSTAESEPGSDLQGNTYSTVIGTNARSTGYHAIAIGSGEVGSTRRVIASTNEIVIGDSQHTSITIGGLDFSGGVSSGGGNGWFALGPIVNDDATESEYTLNDTFPFSGGAGDYEIILVGAGGGGRTGTANAGNQSSSGGGAGAYTSFTLGWDGTEELNVIIGAPGQGQSTPNVHANGGNSVFYIGDVTNANIIVTAGGGAAGQRATNTFQNELVSGGDGGIGLFNDTPPATTSTISDQVTRPGGEGGSARYTTGNFVNAQCCGGGGGVNFLGLTDAFGNVNDQATRGGNAETRIANGAAAGGGGGIFGPGQSVISSTAGTLTSAGTGRGPLETSEARFQANNVSGIVFEADAGNDSLGTFLETVPAGRSIAVVQSSSSSNVNQNNIIIPPGVSAGMCGGGGFAKNNSVSETTSHLYEAQDGFIFGGGGGAAVGTLNNLTPPTGGRGGWGGGGGAGGQNTNRAFVEPSYGGSGVILIRRI